MVIVVMLGAFFAMRGQHHEPSAIDRGRGPLGRRLRRFLSDRPLIPLILLLVALVVVLEFLRPGIVNERWLANTVKFAIPLALLAGCQTLTMLTGGIDLSAGTVATMSAFIIASQFAVNYDPATAFLLSIIPAVLIGLPTE